MSAGAPTSLYRSMAWPTESTATVDACRANQSISRSRAGAAGEHRVSAVDGDRRMRAELLAKSREQCRPIHGMLAAIETEFVQIVGNRLGIDGEARRIGAALGHAGQHGHHERA